MTSSLLDACRAQDAALRAAGVAMWLGAEPTFTDRTSQEPWWLTQAEGGDKEQRAVRLLRAFVALIAPGAETCRAMGRRYPGESAARFCFGARWRRAEESKQDADGVSTPGLRLAPFALSVGRAAAGVEAPPFDVANDPLLVASPLPVPSPVSTEAWLTVTPDPGVVEVNLPPAPDLVTFARYATAVHRASEAAGLSAVRWRYNGDATDSGGGGQLTFGGPTPERSPFFVHPGLLARLVRYHAAHPALSYAFAPECSGSAGQGPRPDEGVRERYEELALALDRLDREPCTAPLDLWSALAPLLVDASGNGHRAELNVEKLWNPWFGERGRLGLVELRALRMQPDPARMVAVAALFRAVAARCALGPFAAPLPEFGADLHDRLALPASLEEDLRVVLADLSAHGLALAPALVEALPRPAAIARCTIGDADLTLTPALEFWPLLGDVASQEREGARLVDSSSARLQLSVRTPPGDTPGRVSVAGWEVPLEPLGAGHHVGAVRYRAFTPRPGLHPGLPPNDPLQFTWSRGGEARALTLHGWRPAGGAYPGLPSDETDAAERRRERVVVAPIPPPAPGAAAPSGRITLDLRRLVAPPQEDRDAR